MPNTIWMTIDRKSSHFYLVFKIEILIGQFNWYSDTLIGWDCHETFLGLIKASSNIIFFVKNNIKGSGQVVIF